MSFSVVPEKKVDEWFWESAVAEERKGREFNPALQAALGLAAPPRRHLLFAFLPYHAWRRTSSLAHHNCSCAERTLY